MLYRIYRPKTFAEIEGQAHVVRTLQGALLSNRVGHAYFFSGPRGTGKTTMARLFAKAINCEKRKGSEPCNSCLSCTEINANKSLALIEIDAASHTGVDNIRAVIDSAQVSTASGGYKIFIIDEVHMLSKSSFNALLKTLEEPPAHTLFILATTEPHKVPETILSRVQRLDFKKLTMEEIIEKLKRVAKGEHLTIEMGAVNTIAKAAGGSLRDAESLLAKIIAYNGKESITEKNTSAILGIVPAQYHERLLTTLHTKATPEAFALIAEVQEGGFSMDHFARQFIDHTRDRLLAILKTPQQETMTPAWLVRVIERFMDAREQLKSSPIPELPLELAVVELTTSPTA